MLTIYPSNRLEDLATLLMAVIGHIQSQGNGENILKPQQVIVESRGIRHWLQMELAAKQGIAMNLQFPMPGAFIWRICRKVLGEQIPADSLYTEDVLRWRIDRVLAHEDFQSHPASTEVNDYWRSGKTDELKRFQLASKLASVFQQYMTFRPAWIRAWDEGKTLAEVKSNSQHVQEWQAHLWQLLAKQNHCSRQNNTSEMRQAESVILHPVSIQSHAMAALATHREKLPKHILLFGINQMPGPSLAFFQALAEQPETAVHLFHLNPCVDYWGDLLSDKQLARQQRSNRWSSWLTEGQVTNPLLANLGQQGKAFCEALQELPDSYEISAFNEAGPVPAATRQKDTVLSCLQRDILALKDARRAPKTTVDDSIYISSAHSPLREIQALHDYLLHLVNFQHEKGGIESEGSKIECSDFQATDTITPGDILVMCPNIEDYAPYVDAVFRRPWQPVEMDNSPQWPCSIADRSSLDEEPLVSAFVDLLKLPDSRFEVSGVLDYLRLPAIQNKFGFTPGELDTIEWWVQEASVHWGVDADDKKQKAGLDRASEAYTWLWGLERLLLGFAFGDVEYISANRLLLPHVEGQYALLLGRLRYFIEQIRRYAKDLCTARCGEDWQSYLQEMKASLFAPDDEDSEASLIIDRAISQLGESLRLSGYAHEIDYRVIRSCLNGALSSPDTSNHFMVGQVTFCSMIPMRSVPFKVIAVLGLNDSDFPRQDRRVSFDLMVHTHHKGDRSRRADDRYLFLETLLSAREKLYLSFQGRAIKDNQLRQPSLVLKELMNYLEKGYGWHLTGDQPADLHQQPLHPFSPACYPQPNECLPADVTAGGQQAETPVAVAGMAPDFHEIWHHRVLPSFNKSWCRLVGRGQASTNFKFELDAFVLPDEVVDIETLVRFFDDPLKALARERLGLYLDSEESLIDDVEPFTVDYLTQYHLRNDLCEARFNQQEVESTLKRYALSGKLPESPLAEATTQQLDAESLAVFQAIREQGTVAEVQYIELPVAGARLGAKLLWLEKGQHLLNYRAAKCKPKDKMRLWLTHLLGSATAGVGLTTTGVFLKEKGHGVMTINLPPLAASWNAVELLQSLLCEWQFGLSQPSVVHTSLGSRLNELSEATWATAVADQLQDNVYFQWFFGNLTERENSGEPAVSHLTRLMALYGPMHQVWHGESSQ